jgi:hypothetical protein
MTPAAAGTDVSQALRFRSAIGKSNSRRRAKVPYREHSEPVPLIILGESCSRLGSTTALTAAVSLSTVRNGRIGGIVYARFCCSNAPGAITACSVTIAPSSCPHFANISHENSLCGDSLCGDSLCGDGRLARPSRAQLGSGRQRWQLQPTQTDILRRELAETLARVTRAKLVSKEVALVPGRRCVLLRDFIANQEVDSRSPRRRANSNRRPPPTYAAVRLDTRSHSPQRDARPPLQVESRHNTQQSRNPACPGLAPSAASPTKTHVGPNGVRPGRIHSRLLRPRGRFLCLSCNAWTADEDKPHEAAFHTPRGSRFDFRVLIRQTGTPPPRATSWITLPKLASAAYAITYG